MPAPGAAPPPGRGRLTATESDRARALDLLLIAAVERGPVDPEVADLVRATLERLDHALPATQLPPAGPALTVLGNRLLERLPPSPAPRA